MFTECKRLLSFFATATLASLLTFVCADRGSAQVGSISSFSPSVTSFISPNDNKQYEVCAYAFETLDNSHHMVGIQYRASTDHGTTWGSWTTASSFTGLPSVLGGAVDNLDDPQVVSIGGDKLVLVVRGWKANSHDQGGASTGYGLAGLPNSIFTDAGIFLAVSTDRGQTWGYYDQTNPQSTITTGNWRTVALSPAYTGNTFGTVEYPRIAYRKGFAQRGYVVWDSKTWTTDGSITYTDRFGSNVTTITNPGVWVKNSTVGIAAFSASDFQINSNPNAPDGWLYAVTTSPYEPIVHTFANPSAPLTTDPNTHFCPGPESPSVSISPDGEIWIAYQQVAYGGYETTSYASISGEFFPMDGGANGSPDVIHGKAQPDGFLYVIQGTCSVSPAGVATFSFPTSSSGAAKATEIVHDEIQGFYNPQRGYLYGKSFEASSPCVIDAMLAQGPSIQVACLNPRLCDPSYTVGIIQSWGTGTSNPNDPRSGLSFIYADVAAGANADDFYTAIPNTTTAPFHDDSAPGFGQSWANNETSDDFPNLTQSFGQPLEINDAQNTYGGPWNWRFFPVLKYVTCADGFDQFYPDASPGRYPSFFVVSYISAYQASQIGRDPSHIDRAQCRTGVAFDNHTFVMNDAESAGTSGFTSNPTYWGTKIDVAGDAANFTILPVWRKLDGALSTNVGNAMFARAYLNNYDPHETSLAFPSGHISTNGGTTWAGPIGKWQFGSWPASTTFTNDAGSAWLPSGTNPISVQTNGIYTAVLSQTASDPDLGDLGEFSNNRRVAMTGSLAHAIVQKNNEVLCSRQRTIANRQTNWTTPEQVDVDGVDDFPCIGSYYRSFGSDQSAVAVSWQHPDATGSHIQVRVREMNGSCGAWSQVFDIPNSECACTNSIVPLTVPVSIRNPERYLLGWIITWEDIQVKEIHSVTLLRGGQSTHQLLRNENWTDYSNYTQTAKDVVLTDLWPIGESGSMSVTSNENDQNLDDHTNEILFTGAPSELTGGAAVIRATYNTSGTTVGAWSGSSTRTYLADQMKGQFDWQPSVTVTSSGQNVAAWSHIGPGTGSKEDAPFLASVRVATSSASGGWNLVQDMYSIGAADPNFHWLDNASATAFPKTTLTGDADPHDAELLFSWDDWAVPYYDPHNIKSPLYWYSTPYNMISERLFNWKYQTPWSGSWTLGDQSPFPTSGVNPQRSFGLYTTGPHYETTGSKPLRNPDGITPYTHGLTYGIGNTVSAGAPTGHFTVPDVGVFKGTYAQSIGVNLYRVEDRWIDSCGVEFQWGSIYVDDSALNMPAREVVLHDGQPIGGVFTSHDAIRDSIFSTEWFDWPPSGEVVYNRWMGVATGNFRDSLVSGEPGGCTARSVSLYEPDSTVRWDPCFDRPGLQMKYTVEMVHQGGRIDTIDQMIYNPSAGIYFGPRTVRVVNASDFSDTVKLRVRADFTSMPDADSNVIFGREEILDSTGRLPDSVVAIGSGGIIPPPDSCFAASGPYSNPSNPGANDVTLLVHYCRSGSQIAAQVYDALGNPVGGPSIYMSDGEVWDRVPIVAPLISGTYYVVVTAGNYSATLGYIIN